MHDEIAHLRVVDRHLRLLLPGVVGLGVVRIDADDVERCEVAETHALQRFQLAAEHQMEQLLRA